LQNNRNWKSRDSGWFFAHLYAEHDKTSTWLLQRGQ
jgi:hypothetical protein